MDPLGDGTDGLALSDSSQPLIDQFAPQTPVDTTTTTDPTANANFFGPSSDPLVLPNFSPSPPNGLSGSQGWNIGSLFGAIGGALGLTNQFQAQQQQLQLNSMSPLQRFGLEGANGQLTQTGQMLLFGGLAIVAFLVLRR